MIWYKWYIYIYIYLGINGCHIVSRLYQATLMSCGTAKHVSVDCTIYIYIYIYIYNLSYIKLCQSQRSIILSPVRHNKKDLSNNPFNRLWFLNLFWPGGKKRPYLYNSTNTLKLLHAESENSLWAKLILFSFLPMHALCDLL